MPRKSRKNVGLIGLGIIGSRVANALRLGGFHVYVWNRTPRAAPNFLPSPRAVAELCDIIQIFVSDAQALFDVLYGMGDALTPSHVIICNATVGPEATIEAARLVKDRGAQFLDAPFTGTKGAAQDRQLVYYIGGDDETLKTVQPALQASSKTIVKIGKIGDAAVIKVATNMITAVTVQTLAEAYAIVKESGIDPRTLAEALKSHGVRSGVSDAKLGKMIDRDYETSFSLKHMFKDVQLGIHIANSLEIDLPATTATAGVMYGGLTRGWADQDFAVLARSYQKEDQPAPLYVAPPLKVPEEKAPLESTPDQLRDAGIKVPDLPPAPSIQKAPSGETKPDPARTEPAPPEPPKAGQFDSHPAGPAALKTDAAPEKAKAEKVPAPPAGNGAPADEAKGNGVRGKTGEAQPARQHTPFVRLRRWFGSGSPQ